MQTKHLFVLIYFRTNGEVGTGKTYLSPPPVKYSLLTVPRRYSLYGSFLLFMFPFCHAFLPVNCSLVVACWERAGHLALLYAMFYCVFVTFPCGVMGQVCHLIESLININRPFERIWLFTLLLLLKLKTFGLSENALKLLTSYLTNRKQCVKLA